MIIHAQLVTLRRRGKSCADKGVHISIARAIEMQMGHGTPPFQLALDRDILPSLSSDVDTNMTPDMFTLMRTAFMLAAPAR